MKKILILLFIPLFLGGCYDYKELNDLAIVNGVGIDYEDEEYEVTFEIISTKKEGESSGSTKAYTVNGTGSTIAEAFKDTGTKLDKIASFDHIDIIVISEDIAREHLEDISDYLLRNVKFRNEFYTVIASDASAKEIFETTSEEFPIVSSFLADLLEHNNASLSSTYYEPFTRTISSILTKGKDAKLSVFTVDDDKISLIGLGLFEDYKLKEIFDLKEATIMNLLLNNNVQEVTFKDENDTVVTIYNSKLEVGADNKGIKVKGSLEGRIKENNSGQDLKKYKTYEELQEKFQKIIEKEMTEVIKKTGAIHSNALNIGKAYYNKTRHEDYFKWTHMDISFDLDLKINKKGLTFELEAK